MTTVILKLTLTARSKMKKLKLRVTDGKDKKKKNTYTVLVDGKEIQVHTQPQREEINPESGEKINHKKYDYIDLFRVKKNPRLPKGVHLVEVKHTSQDKIGQTLTELDTKFIKEGDESLNLKLKSFPEHEKSVSK